MEEYTAEVILVNNDKTWGQMVNAITPEEPAHTYIDLETTGFDPYTERLAMVTLQQEHKNQLTDVFVIDARQGFRQAQREWLKLLVESCHLIGHNIAFDLGWLNHQFRVWPQNGVWDTMLAQQVVTGYGLAGAKAVGISFGLKQLARDYTHTELDKETRDYFIGLDKREVRYEGEDGVMRTSIPWLEPFPDDVVQYAALDVLVLPEIFWGQRYVFDMEEATHPYEHTRANCIALENRTVLPFAHMKLSGMPVNVGEWRDVIEEKRKEAKKLQAELLSMTLPVVLDARSVEFDKLNLIYLRWEAERAEHIANKKEQHDFDQTIEMGWGEYKKQELARWNAAHPKPYKPKLDTDLNLGSPKQLMDLFELLGIKVRNTKAATLEQIADDYPVVKALVSWRKAEKFVTSFGEAIVGSEDGTTTGTVNSKTFRIHPDWKQTGADTNRTACANPNLQQIPARTATGKRLRACVQASDGCVLLVADFGSQELCILAEESRDENMLEVFERGEDPHAKTACLMFGVPEDTNTREYLFQGLAIRDIAKIINYGIAYGMTKYRLSKLLHIGLEPAQELIDRWYAAYPGATKWLERRKTQVDRGQLYSKTLHGWVHRYSPLPPEPIKVRYGSTREQWMAWKDAHREWENERRELQNKCMNYPIQGAGAGIMKLALTLFFESAILKSDCGYSITGTKPKIILAVHDEMVVEARKEDAEVYAKLLGDCMNEAEGTYLKRVAFPKAEVVITDTWKH